MNPNPLLSKFKDLTPEQYARAKEFFPEELQEIEDARPVNKNLDQFITSYQDLIDLKEDVKKASMTNDSILIYGPTGSGKELLAKALHGDRLENKEGKFVDINCAGLPEHLVESELFGHVKGAFTGATCSKIGLLQSAYNGTFFFDEIGELPLSIQPKLLRAVQEKVIRRVGSDLESEKPIPINCRFVSATHKDIWAMVQQGKFREDLFHRLSTIIFRIEGLENRTNDIPLLIRNIIIKDRDVVNFEIEDINEFSEEVIKRYRNKLSGNVRQLQNIVRHWHVLGKFPEI